MIDAPAKIALQRVSKVIPVGVLHMIGNGAFDAAVLSRVGTAKRDRRERRGPTKRAAETRQQRFFSDDIPASNRPSATPGNRSSVAGPPELF
jgi:hypothetical protein